MRNTKVIVALTVLAAMLIFGGVSCGDPGPVDPTPVKVFKITPAADRAAGSSATAAVPAVTVTPASTGGAGATIGLLGRDSKFDKATLSASAGAVTINFENADAGVPHNLHVFKGADAKGQSVGTTDLEAGPLKQVLKLTLERGSYYYHCDVHPTTMKGVLTVQ